MSADPVDRCGIGIASTNNKDPFAYICVWHDDQYDLKERGMQPLSRKEVDQLFLIMMKSASGDSLKLKARAYLYYWLARVAGGPYWKWL